MAARGDFILENPRSSRRGNRFPMTALADAMFQLLIFFMLASSLTPYSLLPLQRGDGPREDAGTGGDQTTTPPATIAADAIVWSVGAGSVVINAQSFAFDRLDALARGLGSDTAPAEVILLVSNDASVQDLATVLAALQSGEISAVRIATVGDE